MLDEKHQERTRRRPAFDRQDFKALIQYIAWRVGGLGSFGARELNRVLWSADADGLALTGHPITGVAYSRGEDGPVADIFWSVWAELEHDALVQFAQDSATVTARVEPDMSWLDRDSLAIVEKWIAHVATDRGDAAGAGSLDYGWRIAVIGEQIPMAAMLASRIRAPTEGEIERGRQAAATLALP